MIRPEITIKPFQRVGADFIIAHNYCILADEQGLGKTLQAIIVQQETDSSCLVICPATLKFGWQEEFEKFTDDDPKEVTVGLKKNKKNIVNYENIYKCTELIMKADLIIIDESQYLIHLDSQRTTYAHRMIKKYKPNRVVLLTGTPIKNRVTDFFSLLMLVSYSPIKNNGRVITDKYKTQDAYNRRFSKAYTMKVTVRPKGKRSFQTKVTQYSGIQNIPELKGIMQDKLLRRLAKNVLDLPPMTFKDVVVSYKNDRELEREFEKYLNDEAYNSAAKKKSAMSVAPFTAKYVKDIIKGGEGPVVVFSDHPDTLDLIEGVLRKAKITSGKITGTSGKNRERDRKLFIDGKLDVLLCSAGAASTGLNLTISRNMVLNDIPWDYSMLYQLLKRIHRIGQTRTCIVHRMIGTIVYKKILASLTEKAEDIKQILGD